MNDTGNQPDQTMTSKQLAELTRPRAIPVEVIEPPGVLDGVELVFAFGPHRTIEPIRLRVARGVPFEPLDGYEAVRRVARYNQALDELRVLRSGLGTLVRLGPAPMEPGSEIWCAYQDLVRLERSIARRQTSCMGNGCVSLVSFYLEVEFWERHHAHMAAAIDRERAANQPPDRE